MRIAVAGENSLIIYVSEQADAATAARVQQLTRAIEHTLGSLLIDIIPAYASILLLFNVINTDHQSVRHLLEQILATDNFTPAHTGTQIELHVYYSVESGPDLQRLSEIHQLTTAEVIAIHQAVEYRVYCIGFAPGFAYMGDVDPRIATPRLATPRKQVAKGSVAIADRQTAVYPAASPGGWNLIGLCPLTLFDPHATPIMPLTTGDRVRFYSIDRDTYLNMGGQLKTGQTR